MVLTQHIKTRMNQRGINKKMVDTVLRFGREKNNKVVLNKKDANKVCKELQETLKYIKKIADKGGITVVAIDDVMITTYGIRY